MSDRSPRPAVGVDEHPGAGPPIGRAVDLDDRGQGEGVPGLSQPGGFREEV